MSRFLLAVSLTLTLALTLAASDWPQFLGLARDGHSPEAGLNRDWANTPPTVEWKIDVGTGWAGPVVAGGRLVLFHRVEGNEIVACFDAANGKVQWTFSYPARYRDDFGFDDGPRATPLIAGDRVFTLGANGDLHGLEFATGKKLWHRNLLADYKADKGFFGVACSPMLAGGKLLVNVGGKGAGIVAFDPATGQEAWKATDDPASYSSPTVAEIGGKTLAVFLTRNGLVALEPETGKVRHTFAWRPRIRESVNAATPLVWNGDIFLTVSYGTGAVLLRPKGDEVEEVWSSDKALSCQYNTPVRVGDYLYGVHGRADTGVTQLRCVEWKTGAVKWSEAKYRPAHLIAADDGLLALTEDGELVRFEASPDAYKERGRVKVLEKPTRAAPALADGRLYARDSTRLVCVKLK